MGPIWQPQKHRYRNTNGVPRGTVYKYLAKDNPLVSPNTLPSPVHPILAKRTGGAIQVSARKHALLQLSMLECENNYTFVG